MEPTTKVVSTFQVTRKNPELIAPAKSTPHEFKLLSVIDSGLRVQASGINFYRRNPSSADPVKVIRDALARALVFYYPFAGRLRERGGGELVVECTGEGVMFVEADADVALDQLGDSPIQPPFPCVEELLYDVPASTGPLDSPLIIIQVTRFACGGFIFANRMSHAMCDAAGHAQFLSAVAELSRGAGAPSIPPVWDRHLLNARSPPRVTCTHREYDDLSNAEGALPPPDDDTVHRSFFFGAAELTALRSHLPPRLRDCSRFELLTACLWRCRTIAVSPEPDEEVRIMFMVDSRWRFNPPIPAGYYGNVIASPVAVATAGDLSRKPLHYAVELVRKTKASVTEEYMRSMVDLLVIRGWPRLTFVGTYVVSDMAHAGFDPIDFGWGKPVYAGHPEGCNAGMSFLIPFKNGKGESGTMVPMRLPSKAMVAFAAELGRMLDCGRNTTVLKASKL